MCPPGSLPGALSNQLGTRGLEIAAAVAAHFDIPVYESVAALTAELETAASLDELRQHLARSRYAFLRNGTMVIHMDVVDQTGKVVASSDGAKTMVLTHHSQPAHVLQANLAMSSPVLPGGHGRVVAWRDDTKFEQTIQERWADALLDLAVMVVCLLTTLFASHYWFVTRPLRRLQRGVRQMGKGYLGALRDLRGAREWRSLATSIWQLGLELESTVRSLVDAQRQAARAPQAEALPGDDGSQRAPGEPPASPLQVASSRDQAEELRQHLLAKCRLLELQAPGDPTVAPQAEEAWHRDVPAAERLGDIGLRNRLDDAALRLLRPEDYRTLSRYVASLVASRSRWARRQQLAIQAALRARSVTPQLFQHRTKHVAGIWRKKEALGLPLTEVQDVFAFRIVVDQDADCYRAFDALLQRFDMQLLSFKDYLAHPKDNGYQSLHLHVWDEQLALLNEVQICSVAMHERAERGSAAHWHYKLQQGASQAPAPRPSRRGWRWLGGLPGRSHGEPGATDERSSQRCITATQWLL